MYLPNTELEKETQVLFVTRILELFYLLTTEPQGKLHAKTSEMSHLPPSISLSLNNLCYQPYILFILLNQYSQGQI